MAPCRLTQGSLTTMFMRMSPHRPVTVFLAALVAGVFAFSYAGPVVCEQVHAHGEAHGHAGEHAHHDGIPAGGATWAPAQTDVGTCPDMMHCGLTLVGPVLESTCHLADQIPGPDRLAFVPLPGPDLTWSPATPPPRV